MFTLAIAGLPAVEVPQTSIVPVVPTLPTGIEVAAPFHIDSATGGVAVLSDYGAILAQHIETIILTRIQERVMLPGYGSRAENALFEGIYSSTVTFLQTDITNDLQRWEPGIQVQSVTSNINNNQPNVISITVRFIVLPSSKVNSMTVTTGGTILQVSSP